jgi:calcineurin-like phosphoesterase family protein
MPMGRLPEWIIADTHFGHDNIIRYSRRPQDHDALMIANWKAQVKASDIVLHLGDVYFKNPELVARAKLPGQIYFLRGNHDRGRAVDVLRDLGWRLVEPFSHQLGKWRIVFTHWPLEDLSANTINVHGHTHTLPERGARYLSLSVEHWDYRPQPLLTRLQERIAVLDNPERRAEHERARQEAWVVADRERGLEDARLDI